MTTYTSLETSKKLHDLGIKVESTFGWTQSYTRKSGEYKKDSKWYIQYKGQFEYPAYTLGDLPAVLKAVGEVKGWEGQSEADVTSGECWYAGDWYSHWVEICELYATDPTKAFEYLEEIIS